MPDPAKEDYYPAVSAKIAGSGPIHAETKPGRFPVEPLNTLSCLLFIVVIFYCVRRTRLRLFRHPLLVTALPFITAGFVCGTLHHAFRTTYTFLAMTYLSIFFAVLLCCIFFWHRVVRSWSLSFVCALILPLAFRLLLPALSLKGRLPVSTVYVMEGFMLLLPVSLHSYRRSCRGLGFLVASGLLFAVAVFFREIDLIVMDVIPFGSHFLWHIFGLASVFFLVEYILDSDSQDGKERAQNT